MVQTVVVLGDLPPALIQVVLGLHRLFQRE
jgi:hypothetical protein